MELKPHQTPHVATELRAIELPKSRRYAALIDALKRLKRLKRYRKIRHIRRGFQRWISSKNLGVYVYPVLRRFDLSTATLNLTSISDFKAEAHLKALFVAPAALLEIPGPRFVGECPIKLYAADTVQLAMPKIEIVEIPSATVIGGTNLVLTGDVAIHPDLFFPTRDVLPAETSGVATVDIAGNLISITSPYRRKNMERAISLLGQCTENYAHWLTETLPKLLVINELPQFDKLPLIVDGWIHPLFLRTINFLDSKKRDIVLLGRWKRLQVSSLVDISPTAYIPPALRGFEEGLTLPLPDPDLYAYSQTALNKLRQAGHAACRTKKNFGKKIYLHREKETAGNKRFIENAEAVEAAVSEYGFVSLNPAKFSFEEQIAIFSEAQCIVAPVGAALANAIFSPPGCRVIALAPYYANANYYYYSNLMGVLGHQLQYLVGPHVSSTGDILNRSYTIDIEALHAALRQIAS